MTRVIMSSSVRRLASSSSSSSSTFSCIAFDTTTNNQWIQSRFVSKRWWTSRQNQQYQNQYPPIRCNESYPLKFGTRKDVLSKNPLPETIGSSSLHQWTVSDNNKVSDLINSTSFGTNMCSNHSVAQTLVPLTHPISWQSKSDFSKLRSRRISSMSSSSSALVRNVVSYDSHQRNMKSISCSYRTVTSQAEDYNSSSNIVSTSQDVNKTTTTDVDSAINKLFEDHKSNDLITPELIEAAPSDAWYSFGGSYSQTGVDAVNGLSATAETWVPVWYNISDNAILYVQFMHNMTGLEYGWSIVAATVTIRLLIFPIMVMSQKTNSRMAHLTPELNQMKARYDALGTPTRQEQLQFANTMKKILKRHNVKPFRAFLGPLLQTPLLIGMFFGMQKIPNIFETQLKTGGMFWFVDLTVPDPYYILPSASVLSFLGLIEIGKQTMLASYSGNPQQGLMMLNIFRGLSFIALPVTINFSSSVHCYFVTSNLLTFAQTLLLQTPAVRKYFDIWDPPKPTPGQTPPPGLMETFQKLNKYVKGQPTTSAAIIKQHNATVAAKNEAARMVRASKEKLSKMRGNKKG